MATTGDSVLCILNPASAGGKTGRMANRIVAALRNRFGNRALVRETRRRGDAERYVAKLPVTEGICSIVAIGGDGTVHECVNGLLSHSAGVMERLTLGILSNGTGQGLARSLGMPRSIEDQIDLLASGSVRTMDVGRISFVCDDGREGTRFFVNDAQVGIGASVVQRVERQRKRVGGALTFGIAAFREALSQPTQPVRLQCDGSPFRVTTVFGIAVGNGAVTAGGMRLVPGASVFDGTLDAILMHESSPTKRLLHLSRVFSGRHITSTSFEILRFRTLTVDAEVKMRVAADGEYLGRVPARISVLPSAVKVITPERGV